MNAHGHIPTHTHTDAQHCALKQTQFDWQPEGTAQGWGLRAEIKIAKVFVLPPASRPRPARQLSLSRGNQKCFLIGPSLCAWIVMH